MRYLPFAVFPFLILSACTAIKPVSVLPQPLQEMSPTFSHEAFDRGLRRFVDNAGRVDYAALKRNNGDLEPYYSLLALYSPDSHPSLFPTEVSKLACWLNAYNAAVIKTVLTHYPISGVGDIRPPVLLF